MTDQSGGVRFLKANQPDARFYRGGQRIASFRGTEIQGDRVPEDWIASTTTLAGEDSLGLTRLDDGKTLRDAVRDAPEAWLGSAHTSAFGASTELLVKLLDAGERLPVHVHPDRTFARDVLHAVHGKTEAWLVLEGGEVRLGFRRNVSSEELNRWVEEQDISQMLEAMHVLQLEPGDAVLVPARLPHAIGAGLFVVELQEPADASLMLEWEGFAIDGTGAGHLGLSRNRAMSSVDRRGWSPQEIAALRVRRSTEASRVLPKEADSFFRAEWRTVRGTAEIDAGFSVLIVTAGFGRITGEALNQTISRGSTLVIPHDAGVIQILGEIEYIRARPPAPASEIPKTRNHPQKKWTQ